MENEPYSQPTPQYQSSPDWLAPAPPRAQPKSRRKLFMLLGLVVVVLGIGGWLGVKSLLHAQREKAFEAMLFASLDVDYVRIYQTREITTAAAKPENADEDLPIDTVEYKEVLSAEQYIDTRNPAVPLGRVNYTLDASGGTDPLEYIGELLVTNDRKYVKFESNDLLFNSLNALGHKDTGLWVSYDPGYTGNSLPLLEPVDLSYSHLDQHPVVGKFDDAAKNEIMGKYRSLKPYTVTAMSTKEVDGQKLVYFEAEVAPIPAREFAQFVSHTLKINNEALTQDALGSSHAIKLWADPDTNRIVKTNLAASDKYRNLAIERSYIYPVEPEELAVPDSTISATDIDKLFVQ